MNKVERRTFSLPSEHAEYIDGKVNSGSYGSASEVVRAGLRALQEQDAAIEQWLKTEVAATYDAMKANPERGIPADEAFASLRSRLKNKFST